MSQFSQIFMACLAGALAASAADSPQFVRMAVDSPARTSLLQTASRSSESEDLIQKFAHFKKTFARSYKDSSEETMRQQLFHKRLRWIEAHNARSESWHAEINQFADRTDDELRPLRGFKKPRVASTKPSSLLESGGSEYAFGEDEDTSCSVGQSACHESKQCCTGLVCGANGFCENPEKNLPQSKDWSFLETGEEITDQGECGSCWAVAAAGVIQLQAARLYGKDLPHGKELPRISPQSILGCTPNKDECGGTGGCDGATPELAFQWAKVHGVRSLEQEEYLAQTNCPTLDKPKAALVGGFVKLPVNQADPIMNALYSVGPLAVAVAASDWFSYRKGVFKCYSDLTVDHAVVLMGYGIEKNLMSSQPYWKIRNSWGEGWGENGFIRLARHPGKEPCGMDYDMQKGVGCKNDPKVAKVCGECGILSDVAYPISVNNVTYGQRNSGNRVRTHKWFS